MSEQINLYDEPGWQHSQRESQPPIYPPPIDTVEFVVRGLRISMSHAKLNREQAIQLFQSWYPEAEVIPDFTEES